MRKMIMGNGNKLFSNCIDCPNRRVGCHAKCQSYHDDRIKLYRLKDRIKTDSEYGARFHNELSTRLNKRGNWVAYAKKQNG